MSNQIDRAEHFRTLHSGNEIFVLPNAWDASSAKLFELGGAQAIATTSGGIAAAHGYPDGNHLPREHALLALRRIVETVSIPVTMDIEAGYGSSVEEVCATVRGVIDAGGVGINIEDGTDSPEVLCAKINEIRNLLEKTGSSLFINARTDVFLLGHGHTPEGMLEETLRRAFLYREAGADGLFVPGLIETQAIQIAIEQILLPLNVMVLPGLASPSELFAHGVSRLTTGAGPMQAGMGLTRRIAEALLKKADYSPIFEGAISNDEMNAMFKNASGRASDYSHQGQSPEVT